MGSFRFVWLCLFYLLTSSFFQFAFANEIVPADHCGLEDPELVLGAPPVPKKEFETGIVFDSPAIERIRPAQTLASGSVGHGLSGGALQGKTVYVSAGHGWTYLPQLLAWRTQRPNSHGVIEDFISTETVSTYLIHYLRNMGAHVIPIRESDINTNLVIVDDTSDDFSKLDGLTLEPGEKDAYKILPMPLRGDENPFRSGSDQIASTDNGGGGQWLIDVPESGNYNVYISYTQGEDRAPDARYIVNHAGGSTEFRVDQRRHGRTWNLLGRFYFEKGKSAKKSSILLQAKSSKPGKTLSFDAIRIGGGMGQQDRGKGVSGYPMFEHNARYNIQLNGAPHSIYGYLSTDRKDDVGARPRFTAWDHEDGEDAVYIAWHTNAPSPHRGTSTYAYAGKQSGTLNDFTGVRGSLELMDAVHSELVSDLKSNWDSDWKDGGQRTAWFGEISPNHNPETPAILVEVAFHDTKEDADSLREPLFRKTAARALSQGIAKYFATRDGKALTLAPEAPIELSLGQGPGNTLLISWSPAKEDAAAGDHASAYVVYTSENGYGFDNGTLVQGTSIEISAGQAPLFFRVTAVNEGGESMPSRVLAGRLASKTGQILIVDAFLRDDSSMSERADLSANDVGTVERVLQERMNDGSYLVRYAQALNALGISFDSIHVDALEQGSLALSDYRAVFWISGHDEETLNLSMQDKLRDYVGQGGNLLFSGTNLVSALSSADRQAKSFLQDILGLELTDEDAQDYTLKAQSDWDELGELRFDDQSHGSYDARSADAFKPLGTSKSLLSYAQSMEESAAILHSLEKAVVITLGFPLETVTGKENREALLSKIVGEFELEEDIIPPDDIEEADGGLLVTNCGCQTNTSGHGGYWFLLSLLLLWRPRIRRT